LCGDYCVPSLQNCEIIGGKSSELIIRKTSKIRGNAKEGNEEKEERILLQGCEHDNKLY
jgi:hypothetical protein